MVAVAIWGSLRETVEGAESVEVEASTLRELLDGLAAGYPGLRPQLERGVTVSIDGLLHNDDWRQPIRPDSEVVLLPRVKGG